MTRTGSMCSSVGPAVTSTCLPASDLGWNHASTSATIVSGSIMRPMPVSPQAWSPAAGPANATPSSSSLRRFRCVAGLSHISTFIAGATIRPQCRASTSVESRSSARPFAALARKFALAGATTIRSRSRDSSICDMLSGMRGSQRSVQTVWPVSACRVTGVTKRVAASVMTTRTSQPALPRARASPAAL